MPNARWPFTIAFQLTDESREQPEIDLKVAMKNSSKLMNPFVCLRRSTFKRVMNALSKDQVMAGKTVITETIRTSPKYLSNKI
jgi:hypothetical protein